MIHAILSIFISAAVAATSPHDHRQIDETRSIEQAKDKIRSMVDRSQVVEFRHLFTSYPKPLASPYVCGMVHVRNDEGDQYVSFIFQPWSGRIIFEVPTLLFQMEWNRACDRSQYDEPLPDMFR